MPTPPDTAAHEDDQPGEDHRQPVAVRGATESRQQNSHGSGLHLIGNGKSGAGTAVAERVEAGGDDDRPPRGRLVLGVRGVGAVSGMASSSSTAAG